MGSEAAIQLKKRNSKNSWKSSLLHTAYPLIWEQTPAQSLSAKIYPSLSQSSALLHLPEEICFLANPPNLRRRWLLSIKLWICRAPTSEVGNSNLRETGDSGSDKSKDSGRSTVVSQYMAITLYNLPRLCKLHLRLGYWLHPGLSPWILYLFHQCRLPSPSDLCLNQVDFQPHLLPLFKDKDNYLAHLKNPEGKSCGSKSGKKEWAAWVLLRLKILW